jgi:WD40 repeat protein
MRRFPVHAITAAAGALVLSLPQLAQGAPSFVRDIKPILQKQCQGCHQPASKSSDLDLTTFAAFAKGGKRGASYVAGNPASSLVIKYINGEQQPRMPIGGSPLTSDQVRLFQEWIAAGAKDDSPMEVSNSGKPPVYLQPPVVTALAFSPDGKYLAVSGNREVLVHKADGSGIEKRLLGLAERILSVAFSADGSKLIAGGGNPAQSGQVQVWDTKTWSLIRSVQVTEDTVFGTSISPDGTRIAAGGADNTVRMIETATGKELFKIGNHENWVLGTVFGIDSKRVITVGRDRAAKLTDANTGAFLENVNLLRGELAAIARHPSKDLIVIGGEERHPYIYQVDRGRNIRIADDANQLRKLDRQNGLIFALAWSPDTKWIAVGGGAPEVNLYDAETGAAGASCKGHSAGIYVVAFSPDSKVLATGGFDGQVRLYDSITGKLLRTFSAAPVTAAMSGVQQ